MTQAQTAVDSAIQALANNRAPTLSLKKNVEIGSGLARIDLLVTHAGGSDSNHESIVQAIADMFGNKLHALANSFTALSSDAFSTLMTGIVYCPNESVPYQQDMAGYTSLSSNMFIDNDEDIWSLRKTEAGKFLVKTNAIDNGDSLHSILEAAFASVSSSAPSQYTGSMEAVAAQRQAVQGGDAVTYVSPRTEEVCFGFVVASAVDEEGTDLNQLIVLAQDQTVHEVITASSVVSTASSIELDLPEMKDSKFGNAVAAGYKNKASVEEMIAYYRQMFIRSPEYFDKLAQRLRAHAYM